MKASKLLMLLMSFLGANASFATTYPCMSTEISVENGPHYNDVQLYCGSDTVRDTVKVFTMPSRLEANRCLAVLKIVTKQFQPKVYLNIDVTKSCFSDDLINVATQKGASSRSHASFADGLYPCLFKELYLEKTYYGVPSYAPVQRYSVGLYCEGDEAMEFRFFSILERNRCEAVLNFNTRQIKPEAYITIDTKKGCFDDDVISLLEPRSRRHKR